MLKSFRSIAIALSIALSAGACMPEPPEYGAYPAADDEGVRARVSKDEATATAQTALDGMNERSYEKWTTRWDSSMTEVVTESVFLDFVPLYEEKYGRFVALEATRLTAANEPGFVRFSFLAEFERGYLMLAHIYAADGDRIVGVHLRDAETGELP